MKKICDKCNGTGKQKEPIILWIPGPSYTGGLSYKCLKCHGVGSLDWIERIVGKKGYPTLSNADDEIVTTTFEEFPWELLNQSEKKI